MNRKSNWTAFVLKLKIIIAKVFSDIFDQIAYMMKNKILQTPIW